jgi:hypothetical protein
MSFNLTKIGRPIARIEGGKLDKNKVYLSTEAQENELAILDRLEEAPLLSIG